LGFQNYQSTLDSFYNHHLLLAPSITAEDGDTEGGAPVTIIEAAASGMPIVSTRHCDIPNVLGESNAKFLAEEKNLDSLTDAIQGVMQSDWESFARENRRHIERRHDIQITAQQMKRLYEKLVR
jgi:colanic acid/amylovoran biosynthesis glycosyltransferase